MNGLIAVACCLSMYLIIFNSDSMSLISVISFASVVMSNRVSVACSVYQSTLLEAAFIKSFSSLVKEAV